MERTIKQMEFTSQQNHLYKLCKRKKGNFDSDMHSQTNIFVIHPKVGTHFDCTRLPWWKVCSVLFELRWVSVGGPLEKVTHLKVRTY